MTAIQCPNCGAALSYNPEHAGMAVACPHCGVPFKMPMPRPRQAWTPPPPEPPVESKTSSAWSRMHWAKELILFATLAWPLVCFGTSWLIVSRHVEQPAETLTAYNPQTGGVEKEITEYPATGALVVGNCLVLTTIYLFVLFFLLVLYFLTKPQPQVPSRWKQIHWAKKLILAATILWPISCFGVSSLIIANKLEQPTETRLAYNDRSGYFNREVTQYSPTGALVVGACMMLTGAYLVMLFFLTVLWFVTKP